MIKNKLTRLLALTAVSTAIISTTTFGETQTFTASVEVQNSFDLLETVPLSFGVISAIYSNVATDFATLTVDSDGTSADIIVNGTDASIVPISAGTAGQFTVENAAPNTVLTITPPSDFDLTDPSSGTTRKFQVSTFTLESISSGTAFAFDTDATGTLVFNVGATLTTDIVPVAGETAGPYDDTTYTGTYDITVNY